MPITKKCFGCIGTLAICYSKDKILVRNMQCMIQFFNEYNQELTMEHWQSACCCALSKEMTGIRYKFIYLMD